MSEKMQMLLKKKDEKIIGIKLKKEAPYLGEEISFVETSKTNILVEQLKINYSKISDENKHFYDVSDEKLMISILLKELDIDRFGKAVLLIENESFWHGIEVDVVAALGNLNGIIEVDKNSLRIISMDGIHFLMIDLYENNFGKWQYEVAST